MNKEWYVGEVRDSLKRANILGRFGLSEFPPAILSVAITGGMQGKAANPNLPETIDEQVQQVTDAYNAGAVLVHIHTRDTSDYSQMSHDPNTYKEVNARIREKCPDIIINNTFVGCRMFFVDKPAAPVWRVSAEARPEVGSLDITRMVHGEMPFVMTMPDAIENMKVLDQYEVKPELECFDPGDFKFLYAMIEKGLVKAPYWVQCIYNGNGITPAFEYLQLAERMMPPDSLLSCIGIGPAQTAISAFALLMGHHVRTGMEDNVYYSRGKLADNNAQLVERLVRMAKDLDRPLATPAQAREMLGIGPPRAYSF
ncbi:3-keto-5-aminohexanoate cleavage protein [Ruminococcaceae bacterium OttesenSCG-928-O06]|nr:3-keto-5-aminohexanoate cleavage protein [Ruminococcaceae bacterium OttesenSCG-928-O06]